MVRQLSITEVKAQFYRLAEKAASGQEIIITKSGRVKAKLVPLELPTEKKPERRR